MTKKEEFLQFIANLKKGSLVLCTQQNLGNQEIYVAPYYFFNIQSGVKHFTQLFNDDLIKDNEKILDWKLDESYDPTQMTEE